MVERAEKAYEEFVYAFGGGVRLTRPMGIFLPKAENTARRLQEVYFRAQRNHMIYSAYGSASESAISEGFCLNGFCVPLERMKPNSSASRNGGGDDYAMHQAMRHLIGNILVTCWVVRDGDNRTIPRWMFVGAAHWLGKRPERLRDNVYYCSGEAHSLSGSGEGVDDPAEEAHRARPARAHRGAAGSHVARPARPWEDHQRCWGYFQVCMEEWRKPFVAMMRDLRLEKGQRESFLKHMGITPEQFHQRWEERVLGKRESMAPRGGGMVTAAAAGRKWITWAKAIAPAGGRFLPEGHALWKNAKNAPWDQDTILLRSRNVLLFARSDDPEIVGMCLRTGEGTVRALEPCSARAPRSSARSSTSASTRTGPSTSRRRPRAAASRCRGARATTRPANASRVSTSRAATARNRWGATSARRCRTR